MMNEMKEKINPDGSGIEEETRRKTAPPIVRRKLVDWMDGFPKNNENSHQGFLEEEAEGKLLSQKDTTKR